MKTLLRTLALILTISLAGGYIWKSSQKADTPGPPQPESSPLVDADANPSQPQKVIVPSFLATTTKSGIISFKEGWVDLSKVSITEGEPIEAELLPYKNDSLDRTHLNSAFTSNYRSAKKSIHNAANPDSSHFDASINQQSKASTFEPEEFKPLNPDSLIMSSKIGIITPPREILPSQLSSSTKSRAFAPIKFSDKKKVTTEISPQNILPGTKSIGSLIRVKKGRGIPPKDLMPGSKSFAPAINLIPQQKAKQESRAPKK